MERAWKSMKLLIILIPQCIGGLSIHHVHWLKMVIVRADYAAGMLTLHADIIKCFLMCLISLELKEIIVSWIIWNFQCLCIYHAFLDSIPLYSQVTEV